MEAAGSQHGSDADAWFCADVLSRFFYCLDEWRYDDLVALMVPEGTWFRQGKLLRGRDGVLRALGERPRTQRTRHVVTNIIVDVKGESAKGTAYMTLYRHDDGKMSEGPVKIPGGASRLLMVRTEYALHSGVWLVANQRTEPEFDF